MHLQIFCIFVAIISLIHLPASSAQSNEQYLTCNQPFQCGNIQGIGYPFWGGNRSESCGHPSFYLNCTGEAPILTIRTRPYRVLSIDNATFTLTAVRLEFWQEDCPQYLHNATLDENHFNYTADSDDLFLYYGCTTIVPSINITNQFPCLANWTEGTFGIYALSVLTNSNVFSNVSCNKTVSVRVNSTIGAGLASNGTSEKLVEVLNSGVGLVWEANNTNCQGCVGSGGVCGSNSSNPGSFVCHCSDHDDAVSCGSSQTGSENKSNLGRKLGIGVLNWMRKSGSMVT